MNPSVNHEIDLLIGPTASGKSAVAFELARRSGAQLVSCDSMKIYKKLEIGVAKPSVEEKSQVVHHLIDWKEPHESCSVAEWLRAAEALIEQAAKKGTKLLFEGGTAMYLKALREGLFPGPGRDEAIRTRLLQEIADTGLETLFERLGKLDPQAVTRILPNDEKRIVRALEVYELTGRPISEQQREWGALRTDLKINTVGLQLERSWLYRRIDERIDRMLAAGWLDECARLLELPSPLSKESAQAIGYRTLFAYLQGERRLEEVRDRICFDTHHLARRQLMWFRKFEAVTWIEREPHDTVKTLADRVAVAFNALRQV